MEANWRLTRCSSCMRSGGCRKSWWCHYPRRIRCYGDERRGLIFIQSYESTWYWQSLRLAKNRHPEIKFQQQDICEWDISEKYDFITAWDSIWHIRLNHQEKVLTKLVSCLNTNGVLILLWKFVNLRSLSVFVIYEKLSFAGVMPCLHDR